MSEIQATQRGTGISNWLERYRASGGQVKRVELAIDWVQQHAPEQAGRVPLLLEVLSRLPADATAVSALILYLAAEKQPLDDEQLNEIPTTVVELLRSLIQLREYGSRIETPTQRHAESLRRLLLGLARDMRVVLMALCWQLLLLREAAAQDEAYQQRLAEETFRLHAPLANRLGIWQVKWELEDLAFRYLHPQQYKKIASLVAERRADREQFIQQFMSKLRAALSESGIHGEVSGRPKHIYSIWRKMQRKGLDFQQLFDVRAVRVQVNEVKDCYTVMGLCHMHWQPIPGEFDDYITNPKGNGYQSLHTAVMGPEGKAVEVQIRTFAMHEHAELGVAAHWRYKEGGPVDSAFDRKVQAMRQLLDSQDEQLDDDSLLESFSAITSEDRVYVLTPKGEVVDMVAGSTVLDFAYHIHSDLGHRCRGAKVNGRIVTLNHVVKTGERVEVLAGKESHPSRDWLNPKLGYLKSPRSRNKVRQWFRREEWEQNLQGGRQTLEAELHRLNISDAPLDAVVEKFNFNRLEELYAAVGVGDLTCGQVVQAILREQGESTLRPLLQVKRRDPREQQLNADDIRIEGVGNLLHQLAKCCQPVPGDEIVGYITQGRGVTIHHRDCANVQRLQQEQSQRVLEVNWGSSSRRLYPVDVRLLAYAHKNLQKNISAILSNEQVSLAGMRQKETHSGEVEIDLTLRVSDVEQLMAVLARINGLANVMDAQRVR
ncbi:MAG: GTP diphosphokinase [Wenzhouxiangellaceae bacterium]